MKYTGEDQIPAISDEEFAAIRATAQPYTVCILKAGPKFEPPDADRTPEVFSIVMEHGRRNAAMHVAGLLPVVSPIADGSGVTGVGIFDLNVEDTRRVMDGDPGVQAGLFTYELHACRSILPDSVGASAPVGRRLPQKG